MNLKPFFSSFSHSYVVHRKNFADCNAVGTLKLCTTLFNLIINQHLT